MSQPSMRTTLHKIYNSNAFWLWFPVAIAFCILLTAVILMQIYPFGTHHMLRIDLFHSGAPLLAERLVKFQNGESLWYSWRGGFGTDFGSSNLSTVFNPLNLLLALLLALLGRKNITEVYLIIYFIQILAAVFSFSWFLLRKYGRADMLSTIFALCYGFMAFCTTYFWLPTWMTAVIILPQLSLAVDRLIDRKRSDAYIFILALGILSFYMSGLFLCGYAALAYLTRVLTDRQENPWQMLRKSFLRFAAASLLSAALCAVVLLPILFGLQFTTYGSGTTATPKSFTWYFPLPQFLIANLSGVKASVLEGSASLPNIYCGLLSFLLFPLYFLNAEIRPKEKIARIVFLLILFLGFNINYLTYAFHGMHFPSSLPHRFSFIYSFLVLEMGYQTLIYRSGLKKIYFPLTGLIYIGIVIALSILYPMGELQKTGAISRDILTLNLICLGLITACLSVLQYRYTEPQAYLRRNAVAFILLVCVAVELEINTHMTMSLYGNDTIRSNYVQTLADDMNQIANAIKDDPQFYRAELYPNRTFSDGRLFDYPALTTFGWTYSGVVRFLDAIGGTASINKVVNNLNTPLINSMLSLKYVFTRGSKLDLAPAFFTERGQFGKIKLFENTSFLPVGYMVRPEIADWENYKNANPFQRQNTLAALSSGISTPTFRSSFVLTSVNGNKMTLTEINPGSYKYAVDSGVQTADKASVEIILTAQSAGYGYFRFSFSYAQKVEIFINGEKYIERSVGTPTNEMMPLGYVKANDSVRILLTLKSITPDTAVPVDERSKIEALLGSPAKVANAGRYNGTLTFFAATLDEEVFADVIESLQSGAMQDIRFDALSISGQVQAEQEGYLLLTIPYDKRWQIKVNGVPVQTEELLGAFIGVRLTPGSYTIEAVFHPAQLNKGIFISLTAVFLSIGLCVLERRKKIKQEGNETTPPP